MESPIIPTDDNGEPHDSYYCKCEKCREWRGQRFNYLVEKEYKKVPNHLKEQKNGK